MRTVTGGTGGCMASNCFAYVGDGEGLYFGSHDTTFQDTNHGLRLYPDAEGEFTRLESGFYKFPHCFAGETWTCDANVIAPYTGSWHETSKHYRRWADTWWDHRDAPMWVKKMRSWQRIIFPPPVRRTAVQVHRPARAASRMSARASGPTPSSPSDGGRRAWTTAIPTTTPIPRRAATRVGKRPSPTTRRTAARSCSISTAS